MSQEIKVVPEPSKKELSPRQLQDYRFHRKQIITWLLDNGKDPEKNEGYSEDTTQRTATRLDAFYRWVWNQGDGYTTNITHEDADNYIEFLLTQDYSESHLANTVKSLKRLFRWRASRGGGKPWKPDHSFSSSNSPQRDYLSRDERHRLREAALEHRSVPPRDELDNGEVDELEAHLAQRFRKPKDEITEEDWDLANNWRIPSLILVSLDAALRPIEIERAKTSWVDLNNGVLRIPKEESAKSDEGWETALTDRSTEALRRWLEERERFEMYDDSDRIWLTLHGNTFGSKSLKDVLTRLCDDAGIDTEDRSVSWYSIRRSTATYLIHEYDLSAAQTQMRHKSPTTTMRYDQTPVEERRNALERL